jgi:hypothetical protein
MVRFAIDFDTRQLILVEDKNDIDNSPIIFVGMISGGKLLNRDPIIL